MVWQQIIYFTIKLVLKRSKIDGKLVNIKFILRHVITYENYDKFDYFTITRNSIPELRCADDIVLHLNRSRRIMAINPRETQWIMATNPRDPMDYGN